jgi:predicted RNA-binding protein
MIWKQMGCKTVKDKSTTLVDKLKKIDLKKHQIF